MAFQALNALGKRDDACPDGKRVGTYQEFEVYCDQDMPFKDMDQKKADNLTHCVDLCSAHNPYCYGVAFDADREDGIQNCWFKSASQPKVQKKGWMTAVLKADRSESERDCPDLGDTYKAKTGSKAEFKTFCDMDMPALDLQNRPADSLADCIDQCGEVSECVGVAYNADRTSSFFNCWLKDTYNESNWRDTGGRSSQFLDGAFMVDVVEGLESSTTTSSKTTSSATSSSTTSSSTSSSADRTSADNTDTTTTDSTADMKTDPTIDTVESATNPAPLRETSTNASNEDDTGVSVGAIAGGVAGGVALLAIILGLAFFFWRKRRNAARGEKVAHSFPDTPPPPPSSQFTYVQPYGQDMKGYYSYNPVELGVQSPPVELSSTRDLAELPPQQWR